MENGRLNNMRLTDDQIKMARITYTKVVQDDFILDLIDTIEALQQEIEQLKDENASLRNWNACEEKLHNELLESDKRRWELESELEDANNYRAGLEAIVDKLRAHVARMRDALEQFKYNYEQNYPMYQNYLAVCQLLREDTVQAYHNPADVEALRKAREVLYNLRMDDYPGFSAICETLAEIDKAIGGKEDEK